MAANTILMDFSIAKSQLSNDKQEEMLMDVLKNYLPQLNKVYRKQMEDGGFVILYTAFRGSFITVRGFAEGLLTINIEYYKKENEEEIATFKQLTKLQKEISHLFGTEVFNKFPPLRRGGINRYYPTADERILEYDIDAIVFEETSPYQKVQVVHTKSMGNMLVLDGLQNLSERDLIYTESIMQRGKEDYCDKEIVILGGGDGALLYELLKENPKLVLMFELDEVVIKACREHMRGCCGDVLDKMKGPNYEIILGDCMKSLDIFMKEGRKFDYVFGDLTDVPVTPEPENESWDFQKLIINTSMKILKKSGKYMTHCCAVSCPDGVKMFEDHLKTLPYKIEYKSCSAFIHSFLEDWLFYQISKLSESQ